MGESIKKNIQAYESERSVKGFDNDSSRIHYGTAGFRGEASKIEHLFFNIGVISGLRSICLKSIVGVMVTASHNPVLDNGAKMIDSNGEMLDSEWESIVEEFCNTKNVDHRVKMIDELIGRFDIDLDVGATGSKPQVYLAMDSRPSSERLVSLVEQGVAAWHPLVQHHNFGILTTPGLHFLVGRHSSQVDEYYNQLVEALGLFDTLGDSFKCNQSQRLIVDCANGVGANALKRLMNHDKKKICDILPLTIINDGSGILNKLCGADHVKTTQQTPIGADDESAKYASLDGDADRIVYFYLKRNPGDQQIKLNLLDGDKILCLILSYITRKLHNLNLSSKISLGAIQTAYANGASSDYLIEKLGLHPDFVDTGVKNLHRQASKYDIAVYFEANGHGSIYCSQQAIEEIRNLSSSRAEAIDFLRMLETNNKFTGDALSVLIIVEFILKFFGWTLEQWDALYEDRPNSLTSVRIPDRMAIKTANAGRTCVKPNGFQKVVDQLIGQHGDSARCFVRASGTEDLVRIYAEGRDQQSAKKLAADVEKELIRFLAA